jgi:hypothetical protein
MKHTRSIMSIAMATIVLLSLCAVYASTSVSAAQSSSRPSVQATPSLVGSPIAAGTSPAACGLNGTTSMYVFVKGNDGALWYRIWNIGTEAWTGNWIPLGGQLTSSPAAVSRGTGYIDVFVRGTNGALYTRHFSGGSWGAWTSLGGQIPAGTGPAACSCHSYSTDVFVEGTNGALYQKTWTSASGWSSWASLGGQLTSSPTATPQDIGQIDVFVRGTNGAVYGNEFIEWSGGWSGWYSIGGQVASGTGPTACACVLGNVAPTGYRLDVFVEGTNGALYQKTYQQGNGWSSWQNLGGKLSSSPTAATPFTNNGGTGFNMPVFVRGAGSGAGSGLLYYKIGYCDAYAQAGTTTWTGWYGPYQGPP